MLENFAEKIDAIGYSSDIAAAIAAFDKQLSRVHSPSAMVSFLRTAGKPFLCR